MIDIKGLASKKSIESVHKFNINFQGKKKKRERFVEKQWHLLTVEFFVPMSQIELAGI